MKKISLATFEAAKRELEDRAYDEVGRDVRIEVNDMNYGDEVTVTLNWSACCSVSASEAREFVAKLQRATDLAECFTYAGYVLAGDIDDNDYYYYIEEEEEEPDDDDPTYIDPVVKDAWSRHGSYDYIIIDIERPRGDGFVEHITPETPLEYDLDGWGAARAFADELGLEYDEAPGDININIGLNRIYDICREYDRIRYDDEEALSKYGVAQAWARAIDEDLKEQTEYKPEHIKSMEYAEGELAGWQITIIYVQEEK